MPSSRAPQLSFIHSGFGLDEFTLDGKSIRYGDFDWHDAEEEGPACFGPVEVLGRITAGKAASVAYDLTQAIRDQQYQDWLDDHEDGEPPTPEDEIPCCDDVRFRTYMTEVTAAEFERGVMPAVNDLVDVSIEDDAAWISVDVWLDPKDFTAAIVKELAAPLLGVYGGKVWFVSWDDADYYETACKVTARVPTTPRMRLSKLFQIGRELQSIIGVNTSGTVSAESALALVLAGGVRALIGQRETGTFEVKSQPYQLVGDHGKHELAKDVSAMANAEGGLIVIGVKTALTADGEHVADVRGLPIGLIRKQQHRDVLDQLVYPPIDGLRLEIAPIGDTDQVVFAIYVPEQPPELMPFVVRGTELAGKHRKSYLAVFERRDDSTLPMTTERLHTFMTVGRALLRGGGGVAVPPTNQ